MEICNEHIAKQITFVGDLTTKIIVDILQDYGRYKPPLTNKIKNEQITKARNLMQQLRNNYDIHPSTYNLFIENSVTYAIMVTLYLNYKNENIVGMTKEMIINEAKNYTKVDFNKPNSVGKIPWECKTMLIQKGFIVGEGHNPRKYKLTNKGIKICSTLQIKMINNNQNNNEILYNNNEYTIKIIVNNKQQNKYDFGNFKSELNHLNVGSYLPVLYCRKLNKNMVLTIIFKIIKWNDLIINNNDSKICKLIETNIKKIFIIEGKETDLNESSLSTCKSIINQFIVRGCLIEYSESQEETNDIVCEYMEILFDELETKNVKKYLFNDGISLKQFNDIFVNSDVKNIKECFDDLLMSLLNDNRKFNVCIEAFKRIGVESIEGLQRIYDKTDVNKRMNLVYDLCKDMISKCNYVEQSLIKIVNRKQEKDVIIISDDDSHSDVCFICDLGGRLICCDGCVNSAHPKCANIKIMPLDDEPWYCVYCESKIENTNDDIVTKKDSRKIYQLFRE